MIRELISETINAVPVYIDSYSLPEGDIRKIILATLKKTGWTIGEDRGEVIFASRRADNWLGRSDYKIRVDLTRNVIVLGFIRGYGDTSLRPLEAIKTDIAERIFDR